METPTTRTMKRNASIIVSVLPGEVAAFFQTRNAAFHDDLQ